MRLHHSAENPSLYQTGLVRPGSSAPRSFPPSRDWSRFLVPHNPGFLLGPQRSSYEICVAPYTSFPLFATPKGPVSSSRCSTPFTSTMSGDLSKGGSDVANGYAEKIESRADEQRGAPAAAPYGFRHKVKRHLRRFWWLHLILFCAGFLIISLCL